MNLWITVCKHVMLNPATGAWAYHMEAVYKSTTERFHDDFNEISNLVRLTPGQLILVFVRDPTESPMLEREGNYRV